MLTTCCFKLNLEIDPHVVSPLAYYAHSLIFSIDKSGWFRAIVDCLGDPEHFQTSSCNVIAMRVGVLAVGPRLPADGRFKSTRLLCRISFWMWVD